MANHTFFIKYVTNRLTNGHHIHIWQRLLWEETTCIDVSTRSESVH
jgi:hypothetical protein